MKSGTKAIAEKLLHNIFTTQALKEVSICLEELAQDKHFKNHASSIVNDPGLTMVQKKSQLGYLLRNIETPMVYNYFTDLVGSDDIWLFDHDKLDYFDEFVKSFQMLTETVLILYLTTAVTLTEQQLRLIARDLTHDLDTQVVVNLQVNPSLIGGVQVKIDNFVYDFSLRTKFQQFQREWLASLDKQAKLTGRYDIEVNQLES